MAVPPFSFRPRWPGSAPVADASVAPLDQPSPPPAFGLALHVQAAEGEGAAAAAAAAAAGGRPVAAPAASELPGDREPGATEDAVAGADKAALSAWPLYRFWLCFAMEWCATIVSLVSTLSSGSHVLHSSFEVTLAEGDSGRAAGQRSRSARDGQGEDPLPAYAFRASRPLVNGEYFVCDATAEQLSGAPLSSVVLLQIGLAGCMAIICLCVLLALTHKLLLSSDREEAKQKCAAGTSFRAKSDLCLSLVTFLLLTVLAGGVKFLCSNLFALFGEPVRLWFWSQPALAHHGEAVCWRLEGGGELVGVGACCVCLVLAGLYREVGTKKGDKGHERAGVVMGLSVATMLGLLLAFAATNWKKIADKKLLALNSTSYGASVLAFLIEHGLYKF